MNIKQTLIMSTAVIAGLVGATGIASADQVTVKSGDTLSAIAHTNNTTVDSLQSINNISDANMIFVGEVLETTGHAARQAAAPVVAQPEVQAPVVAQPEVQTPAPAAAQPEVQAPAPVVAQPEVQVSAPVVRQAPVTRNVNTASAGSTYDQFIANGGTAGLWHTVVMPESTGNPNAVSAAGYRGLGQTKEAWGVGSVATQTQGMIGYANSRYGSIDNAISFRQANGWW